MTTWSGWHPKASSTFRCGSIHLHALFSSWSLWCSVGRRNGFPQILHNGLFYPRSGLGCVSRQERCFLDQRDRTTQKRHEELSADFSYYPGIKDTEVNVYNVIPEELYHSFAMAFIKTNERAFIEGMLSTSNLRRTTAVLRPLPSALDSRNSSGWRVA